MSTKWDLRYLEMASQIAQWSKDPSSKLGAVVIGDNGQILSQGYNGFARGVEDSIDRLNDRETKYDYVVHAEMNCIFNACLNGVSLKGSTIYVFGLPVCHRCAPGLIQVGIKRVVMSCPHDQPDKMLRWTDSWKKTKTMFQEADIRYVRYGHNIKGVIEPAIMTAG